LIEHPVINKEIAFDRTSENFRFAACVAEFGMLLTDSKFKSNASFVHVIQTAKNAKGKDVEGYRKEFITLVRKADNLKGNEEDEEEDLTIR
jgi:Ca-activated chloride channel family protein